jgi:hypothetical protein
MFLSRARLFPAPSPPLPPGPAGVVLPLLCRVRATPLLRRHKRYLGTYCLCCVAYSSPPHFRRHLLTLRSPRVAVTIKLLPFLRRHPLSPHHHQAQFALSLTSCRRLAQWGQSQLRMIMMICHSNCHRARTLIPSPIYLTLPSSAKLFLPPQSTA